MMSIFLSLLTLPIPAVARGELHSSADACFDALTHLPVLAAPALSRSESVQRACGRFVAVANLDAQASASPVAQRAGYQRVVEALTLRKYCATADLVWASGQTLPRPFDVYTAASLGEISIVDMHAQIVAGLLIRYIAPAP